MFSQVESRCCLVLSHVLGHAGHRFRNIKLQGGPIFTQNTLNKKKKKQLGPQIPTTIEEALWVAAGRRDEAPLMTSVVS